MSIILVLDRYQQFVIRISGSEIFLHA